MGHFVFEQLDQNRNFFKKLTLPQFFQKMENTTIYVQHFETYLSKAGLELKIANNKELVKRFITAEFARQLFGESPYFQILLKEDAMIKLILKK